MDAKAIPEIMPHRINDEIYPMTPSIFCSRNKIAITSNKDDLIGKFLVSNKCNIEPNPNVNALLLYVEAEVLLR